MFPSTDHPSYWAQRSECERFARLPGDLSVDVVVVGGGITGLTAALRLQEVGTHVALVEMNRLGGGTTGHSTGHLDAHPEASFQTILKTYDPDQAKLAVQARRAAIEQAERWDRELDLRCDFHRVPACLYTEKPAEVGRLADEHAAAQSLEIPARLIEHAPLPFATAGALWLPDQARFNPLRYVCGLAAAFVERGGRLYEETRVENIFEQEGRCRVATDHGLVTAEAVVVAGHGPLLGALSLASRVHAYQSYVLGVRVHDEVPDALYWDTGEPYHYTRWAASDDPHLLIVGGADHRTGESIDTHEPFRQLERYVRERYRVEAIEQHWSHEYWQPVDGLPYIGRVPGYEHVYQGTGYAGDGLSFGTAAGLLMSDLILGRPNTWAELFDPKRVKPAASAGSLVSGVLHMARHFVGDRLRSGDVESLDEIPAGEGRLIVVDGERLAVYRDEAGELHALSPVCQHMGCIVHWNAAEKTWDCPCHGGRYDARGQVIMGPPKTPLPERPLPEGEEN